MIPKIKYRFRFLLFLFFAFIQLISNAQTFTNEWINHDQTYYRFSIPKTGVYRVSRTELEQAGVPLQEINSLKNIQLFFKGEEIPCYIQGEANEIMEFIEFYAKKNDAWFDLEMYTNPDFQTNPYYSMIGDTAAIFFTWNSSFSNKRYVVSNDQDFDSMNPTSHCYIDTVQQYTNGDYLTGPTIDYEYNDAEGFYDSKKIELGEVLTKRIGSPNVYSNSTQATFNLAFVTYSNAHFHVNISGSGINLDTIFRGITTIKHTQNVNANSLSDNNELVFSNIAYEGTSTAHMKASFIHLNYPATFNFENYVYREFTLPNASGNRQYLSISNFTGGTYPILYDLTGQYRIIPLKEDNNFKAIVPSSTQANNMVIAKETEILDVPKIEACNFVNYANISNKYIILSHPSIWEGAQEYNTYRNGLLINVEELYNQFGYGIKKHPMAIRHFVNYIRSTWSTSPQYLFIIGKGIAHNEMRNDPNIFQQCLVPPMGEPASDVLLTARLDNNEIYATLKTGRLAAESTNEVLDYLSKVQEFENNEPGEWMKRGLHFGGGADAYEQSTFKGYLENYEAIFKDSLFGGSISTFLKTSSDPITITRSDSITNLINSGVSLLTFFGHGTTNGFDQNIDRPSEYENQGKYPLLIANSCYSGNMFLQGKQSQSEEWILTPNRGAIAYLAVVYQGIGSYLNRYSEEFYKQFCYKAYNESLGQIILNSQQYMAGLNAGGAFKSTVHGFNLHGDPAIVLNSHELPDLLMQDNSVQFSPSNLTTEIDSFNLIIIPTNIAKTTGKDFVISINRFFADGSSYDTTIQRQGLLYKDTIVVRFPINRRNGIGANAFRVNLDIQNNISELNEGNNEAYVTTFITSTDVFPTIPYNYSIIDDKNPTLKFSTGDPFASKQVSVFELDTTHFFNSPMLVQTEMEHSGGVIEWDPPISFNTNYTYFIRSAKKENNRNEMRWSVSSFNLKEETKGWKQNAPGQLVNNDFKFLNLNENNGQLTFDFSPRSLKVNTYGIGYQLPPNSYYYKIGYSIDGIGDYGACGGNKMVVVIIDSTTLIPWESDRADYGQEVYGICSPYRTQPDKYLLWDGGSNESIANMINFLKNDVPDGNLVVIYTAGNGNFDSWTAANRKGFTNLFPNWEECRIWHLRNNEPYIVFYRKGQVEKPIQKWGEIDDALVLDEEIETSFTYGTLTSSKVGPAKAWDSFSANVVKSNLPDEISYFNIVGLNSNGTQTILYDSIQSNSFDISNIQANIYPYLELQFKTNNPTNSIPDQLKSWEVSYQPVPDLAINPQRGGNFVADTLERGADGFLSIAYENIAYEPMDSIGVNYWIQDERNNVTQLKQSTLPPLTPGEYSIDTVEFNTLTQNKNQIIWVEFNPMDETSSASRELEHSYFNNLAHKRYYVKGDDTNPLLDVTFDGVHIMDGDLVSASPEIIIQLKDENQYIPLDDTTLFSVYIKSPVTGLEQKIDLGSNPDITFMPASLPENKAQLIYETTFDDDGIYELRVQAIDPSGNESGAFDYNISFEVINESTITNVFNYPNPFSTSTQFVFELTGSEIPDEFRIDILTVTGKIVKVIYLEDLGPINIGKNISEYRWDGRDMYGDPLGNGVYFYRVFARLYGQELKIRDTGTSQYFKNGFGKMYLMR